MSIDIMYNIHYVCNKLLTSLDCNSLAIQCRFCQMKLSLRGEYALRALLVLGLEYDQPVVRIQTISEQQNIPKRFLEQILNELKSAGVVQSKRGVSGGYRLARRPEEITLAAIIRHLEGGLLRPK